MLRNYEMEDQINCFIIFMIDKYEIFYIIIRRKIASRKIISSQTKFLLSFRTRCIAQSQTIHFVPNDNNHNEIFHSGRKGFHDRHISSIYDIIYFIFGTCQFYKTMYFIFHFIIMQHIKIPCVSTAID